MKIPKGKVKTYKEVAIGIKMPKSARAVANACAKNPYAPKVPCHRVIRSDGSLGGFSAPGGIKIMSSFDGEIPAVWFLISSIGFLILSLFQ